MNDTGRELLELKRRIEDALIHYQIGVETDASGLYVDWRYVAGRMAAALEGADEQEREGDAAE